MKKNVLNIAALYIRVSTDKQEELSPESQKDLLLEYAKKNGLFVPEEFIFMENGISGKKADKRPEFQRMIATAKAKPKQFDVILLWKFSRFARNQDESIFYKNLLRNKCGVDVVSISEPILDGMFGKLIERIIEWNDEFYSYNLSGEVMRGMTKKAQLGGYQARPPLGYKIVEYKKPPVIVPAEAYIVRKIFHMYVHDNKSPYGISKTLNSLGIKTQRGNAFERRSIEYILQNPTYIGMTRWNRTINATNEIKDRSEWIIAKGSFEAIIDEETFRLAQERHEQEFKPRGSRPVETHRHFLSGVLKCSNCGRTLISRKVHKNGNTYYSFQCHGYMKGKCLVSHQISAIKLVDALKKSLQEVIQSNHVDYSIRHSQITSNTDLSLFQKQLEQISIKEQRIKTAYINGIDTLEEYKQNKEKLADERITIEKKINEKSVIPERSVTDKIVMNRIKDLYNALEDDTAEISYVSSLVLSVIDKIVFFKSMNCIEVFYFCS